MIQIFAEILKIFKFQTKMFVIYKIFSSCFTCDKKSRAPFELKDYSLSFTPFFTI